VIPNFVCQYDYKRHEVRSLREAIDIHAYGRTHFTTTALEGSVGSDPEHSNSTSHI